MTGRRPRHTGGRPRRGVGTRVTVCLRLDPELLEKLDEAAEERGETRTEYVEAAVRVRLREEER